MFLERMTHHMAICTSDLMIVECPKTTYFSERGEDLKFPKYD
tara:strand:- start:388 stop:513 length:126 start_codon:yes stop_codon:yes gene_type:complete